MIDIRNVELKTVTKVLSSQASTINVGGKVPTGMKRWVTFVAVEPKNYAAGASNLGVYLASVGISNPSKASIVATGNRKALLMLRASTITSPARKGTLQVPKVPNINTPLFSIASGKWLGAFATKTTAVLTMQYFDE